MARSKQALPVPADAAHDATLRVLPCPNALGGLSKNEVEQYFFRTMTSSQFGEPKPPVGSQQENMLDVHFIGQRSTKYMDYPTRRAPLMDRSACRYSKDYSAPLLGDNVVCRQLAAEIRAKSSGSTHKSGAPFSGGTKYAEDFPRISEDEMRRAIQESFKPLAELTNTTGAAGGLMEKTSAAHREFGAPSNAISRTERAKKPRTNLSVPKMGTPLSSKTHYRENFVPPPSMRPSRRGKVATANVANIAVDMALEITPQRKREGRPRPSSASAPAASAVPANRHRPSSPSVPRHPAESYKQHLGAQNMVEGAATSGSGGGAERKLRPASAGMPHNKFASSAEAAPQAVQGRRPTSAAETRYAKERMLSRASTKLLPGKSSVEALHKDTTPRQRMPGQRPKSACSPRSLRRAPYLSPER